MHADAAMLPRYRQLQQAHVDRVAACCCYAGLEGFSSSMLDSSSSKK